MRRLLITAVLATFGLNVMAQDLGSISWKNPVRVNGGLNVNWTAYSHGGYGGGKRDPFAYTLSGNLGISVFDWSIPLSFALTSRKLSYSQPFNRIGIAPRYKWIRLYGGYTSMSFSPYSLSGYSFLGAGVELSPGPYRIAVMYGRLNNRIDYDPVRQNTPCFTRMGYGAKFGYEVENTSASFSVFTAKDDRSSITLPSDTLLKAKQNVVLTLQGRQRIYGKLFFEGEVANSVLTNDLNGVGSAKSGAFGRRLISTNGSTVSATAFNVLLAYRGDKASTEVKYERVNPGYETLGAYYTNNNFDNLTLGQSVTMMDGKLNLSGDFGMERSNLVLKETNSDLRLVGSVNGTYTPNEKWSYNLSYSNFTSFTKVRPLDDPYFKDELDSLSFYQVNQTASAAVTRSIASGENRHTIIFSGSYQRSSNKLIHRDTTNLSTFYNGSLIHSYSVKALALGISESFNFFYGDGRGSRSMSYGPNVSLSKQFLGGKVTSALSCGYNQTEVNGITGGKILTAGLSGGYSIGKAKKEKGMLAFKQRVNANISYIKRYASAATPQGHELTAVVTYAVSF